MGYTHYFENMKRPLTRKEVSVIKEIIVTSDVEIVGGSGKDGTKAKVTSKEINLNGLNEDSHEDFTLGAKDFCGFCKTAEKPYDVVVVAILHYLSQQSVLTWSSDGDEEDHFDGMCLVKKVVGDNLSQKGV